MGNAAGNFVKNLVGNSMGNLAGKSLAGNAVGNSVENLVGNSMGNLAGKSCEKILLENLTGQCGWEKANLRKAVIGGNLAFGIG